MPIYRLAQTSTSTTSGNAAADVATPTAAGVKFRLMEYGLFLGAATASTFSLRRGTTLGTRTTPTALVPENPDDPTLTGINLVDQAVAFSAEPAEVTPKLASIGLPATIGVGIIWTFPRGIICGTQLSLICLHDATNAASHHHNVVCDL